MDLRKLDWAFEYASRTSQHGGLPVIAADTCVRAGAKGRSPHDPP